MNKERVVDFVLGLIMAVAPVVAGHVLEGRKQEVIHHYRPDDVDVSFAAYVSKHKL